MPAGGAARGLKMGEYDFRKHQENPDHQSGGKKRFFPSGHGDAGKGARHAQAGQENRGCEQEGEQVPGRPGDADYHDPEHSHGAKHNQAAKWAAAPHWVS
jgi:hypothetical protein